jgi:hypothetical protein
MPSLTEVSTPYVDFFIIDTSSNWISQVSINILDESGFEAII